MTKTKTISPSGTYQLVLPEEIKQREDERVSSFWLAGGPVLLQISSYIRSGEQLGAKPRLLDRIAKSDFHSWNIWEQPLNESRQDLDQAIADMIDIDGLSWLHAYLVWPHLTVYATISGPRKSIMDRRGWACEALMGLKVNRQ